MNLEDMMKLNPKALAITLSLLWGACVLVVAVLNQAWPGYGVAFLNVVASIYPGFHRGGLREALVGTLYALLDGAMCGMIVAWLYNNVSAGLGAA